MGALNLLWLAIRPGGFGFGRFACLIVATLIALALLLAEW